MLCTLPYVTPITKAKGHELKKDFIHFLGHCLKITQHREKYESKLLCKKNHTSRGQFYTSCVILLTPKLVGSYILPVLCKLLNSGLTE